jgi:hypothetical protein
MASAIVIEPVAAHDAHLLQLDLDSDQTRSATSTPRSNTIGNFNSPIKHDQRLQLPDQTRSATSTPRSNTIDNFNSFGRASGRGKTLRSAGGERWR